MKTKLVRIGNSKGIRIPKPLLEEVGLDGEVTLTVTDQGLVIEAAANPRADWESAAALLHKRGEDGLLDEPTPTAFDDTEWEWE